MNNFAKTMNYSLVCGLVALTTVGCGGGGSSSSSSGSSGSSSGSTGTSSGGDGGTGLPAGVPLVPSSTGFVDDMTSGVVGAWYVYSDGFGADGTSATGDCVSKGMFMASQCSMVTSPTPDGPFPPAAAGMCLTGTAAMVALGPPNGPSPGAADYSDIFGEGIGLDLNNPGTGDGGGTAVVGVYNASMYTGIAFDLSFPNGMTQANMRVQFPTTESLATGDSAFWGSAMGVAGSPVAAGPNVVPWSAVGGPEYATAPPAFDNTKIQAIQFSVYTDATATVPVSFCVNNLELTTM